MTKEERKEWRKQMADCGHPVVEVEQIDGTEYGICQECLWIMPGSVARMLQNT